MKEIQAFNYIPFFKAFNMNKVFINEPLSFEIWIALMLAQQPIEDSLKALKISNLEKSNIQNFVNLIKNLAKGRI